MINLIQEDYLSFVQTFKTKYETNAISLVWVESNQVPEGQPNDLSDIFELKIKSESDLPFSLRLISTLNFYNNYILTKSQITLDSPSTSINFRIEDDVFFTVQDYRLNGLKIEDESCYEEDNLSYHSALAKGNSYIEHLLLCDFIDELADLHFFKLLTTLLIPPVTNQ